MKQDTQICLKLRMFRNTSSGKWVNHILRVVYSCHYDKTGRHGAAQGNVSPGDEMRVVSQQWPGKDLGHIKASDKEIYP